MFRAVRCSPSRSLLRLPLLGCLPGLGDGIPRRLSLWFAATQWECFWWARDGRDLLSRLPWSTRKPTYPPIPLMCMCL